VKHENENNWSQVIKEKSSRNNQMTQQSSISTNNRFRTLNEVAEETEEMKALSYPKKDNEDRPIPTVVDGLIWVRNNIVLYLFSSVFCYIVTFGHVIQ
jgi:hypothetical protein